MDKKKKLILQIIIFIIIVVILTVLYNYIMNSYINKQINKSEKEENKMNVAEIMSQDFEKVLNSQTTVLVDFFATWCGPCKMMSPIIENIAEENSNVKVVKVDVDKNQDLAMKYSVMSIPTIIIFKNGKPTATFVGVKDKQDIVNAL